MNLSSLSKYPWPKGQALPVVLKADPTLSPRAVRILRDLALLLAIVVLLCGLRIIARGIEPSRRQLPFDLVMERFSQVQTFDSRQQVEELLGAPSNRPDLAINLQEHMERAELIHRALWIPPQRSWQTWSDPKDKGKWVAILFVNNEVYYTAKHGF